MCRACGACLVDVREFQNSCGNFRADLPTIFSESILFAYTELRKLDYGNFSVRLGFAWYGSGSQKRPAC
jgi:hypothetical protein